MTDLQLAQAWCANVTGQHESPCCQASVLAGTRVLTFKQKPTADALAECEDFRNLAAGLLMHLPEAAPSLLPPVEVTDFFNERMPVPPVLEELRQQYYADKKALEGPDCTDCELSALRSRYISKIKALLQ